MITQQQDVVIGVRDNQATPDCQKARTCRCGQELEGCARKHCPRCGTTLRT